MRERNVGKSKDEEWEHERHQKEPEWQAAVMEKLKQEWASEQEKRLSGVVAPPGGSDCGISSEVRVATLDKHVEAKERVTPMGSESPTGRTLTANQLS